jgi:glycosyltransferase involved in cell wall biosynthesis
MASSFSIVIIAKNAALQLQQTLAVLQGVSTDVIVIENGSTDNTIEVAKANQAKVISMAWMGYGATKNYGNSVAKHKWVLSLDADEVLDKTLQQHLQHIHFTQNKCVYVLKRYMVWNNKILRFGGSVEHKIRLFHSDFTQWNDSAVHESLELNSKKYIVKKIAGKLLHYSYQNVTDAKQRNAHYAALDADKKYAAGKKYFFYCPIFRGGIEFLKVFICKLGFLDGKNGWQFAKYKQFYKQEKYRLLQQKYQSMAANSAAKV